VKPSQEQLIGSHCTADEPEAPPTSVLIGSHCTADEPEAPPTSMLPREPCIPASFHDTVDSGNCAGWESYPVAVVKRQCPADRGLRARSYPPACKSPAVVDDWLGLAPLASPETLSESSSLVSCGSSGAAAAGASYQRIMSSILPPRMDPILQSPARLSNSGFYLESADVVGDLAALSPCVENLPSPLAPRHHNPDIVPVPHFVSDAPSDGSSTIAVRGSSPDVVQETRSAADDQRGGSACVECWHDAGRDRGMCTCGSGLCTACATSPSPPDIVTTHHHVTAARRDLVPDSFHQ